MQKYKHWDLYEELPAGWRIDKSCGSPLHGYEFATDGKSILRGGKRALVRVLKKQMSLGLDRHFNSQEAQGNNSEQTEKVSKNWSFQPQTARAVNELARQRFKQQMLKDMLMDLMICEIEGWAKTDYLNELRELINSIGRQALIEQ